VVGIKASLNAWASTIDVDQAAADRVAVGIFGTSGNHYALPRETKPGIAEGGWTGPGHLAECSSLIGRGLVVPVAKMAAKDPRAQQANWAKFSDLQIRHFRGRSSAGRAPDWQSGGSWVQVPSPPHNAVDRCESAGPNGRRIRVRRPLWRTRFSDLARRARSRIRRAEVGGPSRWVPNGRGDRSE
jgi:hypothetical protein